MKKYLSAWILAVLAAVCVANCNLPALAIPPQNAVFYSVLSFPPVVPEGAVLYRAEVDRPLIGLPNIADVGFPDAKNSVSFLVIEGRTLNAEERAIAVYGEPVPVEIHSDADAIAIGLPPVSQWTPAKEEAEFLESTGEMRLISDETENVEALARFLGIVSDSGAKTLYRVEVDKRVIVPNSVAADTYKFYVTDGIVIPGNLERWIALCGQPVNLAIHSDADAIAHGLPPVSKWMLGTSDMLNLNASAPSGTPAPSNAPTVTPIPPTVTVTPVPSNTPVPSVMPMVSNTPTPSNIPAPSDDFTARSGWELNAEQAAEELYKLGLFRGTGTNTNGTPIFALDETPSRNQALIMLVRLLGKEDEAFAGTWTTPFVDVVPNSAPAPYVGYAYANGLTKGTTETTYSGVQPVSRNQYLLFLMRVLGYDQYQPSVMGAFPYEDGDAMTTARAAEAAQMLGLTDGMESGKFTRGDIALLSYRALDTFLCGKPNGSDALKTLRESLGLGGSPRITNRPLSVETTKYDSYQNADAAIHRDDTSMCTILDEISIPGGTLVSYRWGGIPNGPVNRVWAVCQDGTVISMPLPRLNMARYPEAVNLSYDARTGTVTYEADIPNDLSGNFGITQFRRAGTYHYTCDLNSRTAVVTETELVRR